MLNSVEENAYAYKPIGYKNNKTTCIFTILEVIINNIAIVIHSE